MDQSSPLAFNVNNNSFCLPSTFKDQAISNTTASSGSPITHHTLHLFLLNELARILPFIEVTAIKCDLDRYIAYLTLLLTFYQAPNLRWSLISLENILLSKQVPECFELPQDFLSWLSQVCSTLSYSLTDRNLLAYSKAKADPL